jgi:hypothetical protein
MFYKNSPRRKDPVETELITVLVVLTVLHLYRER